MKVRTCRDFLLQRNRFVIRNAKPVNLLTKKYAAGYGFFLQNVLQS